VTLRVLLPVGISFYTFVTMSYVIDVYRREIPAARDPVDFAVFVAYFPHLVAGPILRATALLPQIQRPRLITSAQMRDGLWLNLAASPIPTASDRPSPSEPVEASSAGRNPTSTLSTLDLLSVSNSRSFSWGKDVGSATVAQKIVEEPAKRKVALTGEGVKVDPGFSIPLWSTRGTSGQLVLDNVKWSQLVAGGTVVCALASPCAAEISERLKTIVGSQPRTPAAANGADHGRDREPQCRVVGGPGEKRHCGVERARPRLAQEREHPIVELLQARSSRAHGWFLVGFLLAGNDAVGFRCPWRAPLCLDELGTQFLQVRQRRVRRPDCQRHGKCAQRCGRRHSGARSQV
jgi:hypothetical protein